MDATEIEALLNSALSLDELKVTFDGSQCKIIAVAALFGELSRVKRQQTVYQPLTALINDGTIHAVTIKTFTPEQWQREKLFN